MHAAPLPCHPSSPWGKPPAWLQSRMGGNDGVRAGKVRAHLSAPISLSDSKDGPGWSQAPRLGCLPNSAQQFCPNLPPPASQHPSARSSPGSLVLRSVSQHPVSTDQRHAQLSWRSRHRPLLCPASSSAWGPPLWEESGCREKQQRRPTAQH